jgi:hypothetical protein
VFLPWIWARPLARPASNKRHRGKKAIQSPFQVSPVKRIEFDAAAPRIERTPHRTLAESTARQGFEPLTRLSRDVPATGPLACRSPSGEALHELERRLRDSAPARVDGERMPAVRELRKTGDADFSAEKGSGSTPRNGAREIATDDDARPRPARISVSRPPNECPMIAASSSECGRCGRGGRRSGRRSCPRRSLDVRSPLPPFRDRHARCLPSCQPSAISNPISST